MSNLSDLMKEYNKNIARNKKAEKWFAEHTVNECLNQIELLNEVVRNLSNLRIKIESITKKKMTNDEILNGFKEVRF